MKALLYADWIQYRRQFLFIGVFWLICACSPYSSALLIVWALILGLVPFLARGDQDNWLTYSHMLPISARDRVFRRYIYAAAVISPFPLFRLGFLVLTDRLDTGLLPLALTTALPLERSFVYESLTL